MAPLTKSAAQELAVADSQRQRVAALATAIASLDAVLLDAEPVQAGRLIAAGRSLERLLRQYGGKWPDRLREPCHLARRAMTECWPDMSKYLASARAWLADEARRTRDVPESPAPAPVAGEQADSFAPPLIDPGLQSLFALQERREQDERRDVADRHAETPLSDDGGAADVECHQEKDSE